MASELKPCPFCGSNFNIGQEPHDNHPVAGMFYIFHEYGPIGSEARKCKLNIQCHFNTEEEAVAFWNTRPAPAEDEVTIPRYPTEAMMDAGLYHCSHDMEWSDLYTAWQAMFDAVTLDGGMTEHAKVSSAPAATDTGLETVAWESMDNKLDPNDKLVYEVKFPRNGDKRLVYKSQAEELLADLHAAIAVKDHGLKLLKADNAALAARVKELEQINAVLMGDDEDKPRYTTKRLKHEIARATEILEAKLAAAAKISQEVLSLIAGDAGIPDRIRAKARAVLGGKPS